MQAHKTQIEKAIAVILNGDVILTQGQPTAKVRSQDEENQGTMYRVARNFCTCQGFRKWGYCKHSLAFRMVIDAIRAARQSENRDSIIQSLGVMVSPDNKENLYKIADKAISHVRRFPTQEKGQKAA